MLRPGQNERQQYNLLLAAGVGADSRPGIALWVSNQSCPPTPSEYAPPGQQQQTAAARVVALQIRWWREEVLCPPD